MRRLGLFVLGTDTGVGKTVVACGLLRLAHQAGRQAVPYKPVETGVTSSPRDARALRSASSVPDWSIDAVCPFPFPAPVAPVLAARLSGRALTLESIRAACPVAAPGRFLIAEGAGGVLTPYTLTATCADVADALDLPVVLVARNALGTINQTALALEELRRRRLRFAGLILVTTDRRATKDQPYNAELVGALTGVQALATLPYSPTPNARVTSTALGSIDPVRMASAARPLPLRKRRPRQPPASEK